MTTKMAALPICAPGYMSDGERLIEVISVGAVYILANDCMTGDAEKILLKDLEGWESVTPAEDTA